MHQVVRNLSSRLEFGRMERLHKGSRSVKEDGKEGGRYKRPMLRGTCEQHQLSSFREGRQFKFVTTLEKDNFDCTKMSAHFKIHSLSMGGAHSQVEACIASPNSPLVSVNNSQLCSIHNSFLEDSDFRRVFVPGGNH